MKKLLLLAALCSGFGATMANATITTCLGADISNVVGQTFTCFGLTYSNFVVSSVNPSGVVVGVDHNNTGRDSVSGNIDVALQFGGTVGPNMDVQIAYAVAGGTIGIDWMITPSVGGKNTLSEFVCPAASGGTGPGGCNNAQTIIPMSPALVTQGNAANQTCGVIGCSVIADNQTVAGSSTFVGGGQGLIYLHKDMLFSNSTMSEFENSNDVPEPVTLLSLGGGLIALGVLRMRRKAS